MTVPTIPKSHKIISILAILWNLFGVMSFIGHTFMSETQWAKMTPEQKTFMEAYPTWAYVVFGVAVVAGVLGSVGLLMRKKWSVLLLAISLVTAIINQLWPLSNSNYVEAFGGWMSVIWLPIIIIVIATALYFYSKNCDSKGWLD